MTRRTVGGPVPQADGLPGRWRLRLDKDIDLAALIDQWQPHHTGPHSLVYRCDGPRPILIKLAEPRSLPRDALRKYVRCQAQREYRSAHRLQAAGLRTPAVYGWGYSLSPFARFESLLIMEWIRPFHSALTFIRHETDGPSRLRFLQRLADEIARMHGHGLIHKDGHFDNIGLYDAHSLIWIDNDIRHAPNARTLRGGFVKMLALLERTARGAIDHGEWHAFYDRLAQALAEWPKARILENEIQRRG